MKFSKKIVAMVIFLNVLFTSVVLWISSNSMVVPDSLIIAWFTFTGTELLTLGLIKYQDIRTGGSEVGVRMSELNDSLSEVKFGLEGLSNEVVTQKEIFKGGILNAKVILDKDSE